MAEVSTEVSTKHAQSHILFFTKFCSLAPFCLILEKSYLAYYSSCYYRVSNNGHAVLGVFPT
jgi:hypothetical protein